MTSDSPHTSALMLNKYCRVMHWCWSTPMPREPVLRNICSDPRASIPQLAVLPGPFQQDLRPTDSPRSLLFPQKTGSLARVKGRVWDNVLFTCISSSSSFFDTFTSYSLHWSSLAHIFLFFSTSLRIFWPLPYRTRGGEPRKYSWNIARTTIVLLLFLQKQNLDFVPSVLFLLCLAHMACALAMCHRT